MRNSAAAAACLLVAFSGCAFGPPSDSVKIATWPHGATEPVLGFPYRAVFSAHERCVSVTVAGTDYLAVLPDDTTANSSGLAARDDKTISFDTEYYIGGSAHEVDEARATIPISVPDICLGVFRGAWVVTGVEARTTPSGTPTILLPGERP